MATGGAHVTLNIEGNTLRCCKETLTMRSDYFKAMFACNMRESQEDVITLRDVPCDAFRVIWEHCRGGELAVTCDNVWDIVMTSQMMQFSEVLDLCLAFLKANLRVHNCVATLTFAAQFSLTRIYSLAKSFILYHFQTLVAEGQFGELPRGEMVSILSSDCLNVPSEMCVFEAVTWLIAAHEKATSLNTQKSELREAAIRGFAEELLECVRFDDVGAESLSAMLSDCTVQKWQLSGSIRQKVSQSARTPRGCTRLYPRHCLCVIDTLLKGAALFEFKEKEKEMSKVLPLPIEKGTCGYQVCSWRQYLYVVGGELVRIGSGRWMESVWRYDTFTAEWASISALPCPRRHHAVCCDDDGNLYVAGGFGRYRQKTLSVMKLDVSTGGWSALRDLPVFMYKVTLFHTRNTLHAVYGFDVYYLDLDGESDWRTSSVMAPLILDSQLQQSLSSDIQFPVGSVKHVFFQNCLYFVANKILMLDLDSENVAVSGEISTDPFIPELRDPFRLKMCFDAVGFEYLTGKGERITDLLVSFAHLDENEASAMHVYRQTLNSRVIEKSVIRNIIMPQSSNNDFQMVTAPRMLEFHIC